MLNSDIFFIDTIDLEYISTKGENVFKKLSGQNILIIGAGRSASSLIKYLLKKDSK